MEQKGLSVMTLRQILLENLFEKHSYLDKAIFAESLPMSIVMKFKK